MKRVYFANLIALTACASAFLIVGCGPKPANNANNSNKPAISSPTPDPCATVTDQEIWKKIYAEIAKDGKLGPQVKHFNVMSKQREVSFNGWADSSTDKDTIVNIAKTTACVANVDPAGLADAKPTGNSPELPRPGGCASGYKPCREFCIPEGDDCTPAYDPFDPGGNVNSNTPPKTNSNTSGNGNGNRSK